MANLLLILWTYCFQAPPGPVVTCAWRAPHALSGQAYFTLSLAKDNLEIENQYILNGPLYTRVLQYLNYDIAQDAFLSIPGRPDSLVAVAASYPRQYGSTGRSSVLLVFPVPDNQLNKGCHVTFRGDKFELGTLRFFFTAQDIKVARKGQPARQ